ncbi:hypothetical protein ACCS75_35975, partial [Rhizobium ruizarguesonis]
AMEMTRRRFASTISFLAMTVRDEGGVILPMFNDFVNASTTQVKGYVHDIGNDMSNGYVATRVRLDARWQGAYAPPISN